MIAGSAAAAALLAAAAAVGGEARLGAVMAVVAALLSAYAAVRTAGRERGISAEPATPQAEDQGLRDILNVVPSGIALFGPDGRLQVENGRWRDLVVPDAPGPIVGSTFDDLMRIAARSAIDAKGREDAWRGERQAEFDLPSSRLRIPFAGGKIVQLDHRLLADGRRASIAGDTTRIETAAASLDAMRQQAVSFLDNILDAVLVIDERGTVERANLAAERMFGMPRSALIGRSASVLFASNPADDLTQLSRAPAALAGKLIEGQARRIDGAFFPVEVAVGEIASDWRLADRRAARRRGFVATLRDLTAKKEAERHLRQAQKLEAVGTLAGGIAHDFNNLLAIVLGHADLTLADAPEQAVELRESLSAITVAARRGKDLVRQLLTFSRGSGETRAPLDVVPLVKEAAKLVRATLPPGIELRVSAGDAPATVIGNATQIHQILINLCTNAVHALVGRGGSIEIAVASRALPSEANGREGLAAGRYVSITVIDDGPGIDPAIADRIFEPFFTTKDVGQGTGLGLAVAHGIARDHGGTILVESDVGSGARFDALFPVHDGPIDAGAPASIARAAGGGEHILIVEDEPALRHVIDRHLTRLGYRVASAASSIDALDRLRAGPKAFDAILTDLSMPGLTGVALAEAARAIGVVAPIILSTGGRKIDPELADRLGIVAQVLKPAVVDDIGMILRRALGA